MITDSGLEPLTYENVLLLPNYSEINSRKDVNLYVKNESYMPIFSSPMKNISNVKLVRKLGELGAIGVLHRFYNNPMNRLNDIDEVSLGGNPYGIAIGVNDFETELRVVEYATNRNCKFIFLDTASGHMELTLNTVEKLYSFREKNNMNFKIVSGNVVTWAGSHDLADAGSDMIRVTIGSGQQCLTSTNIGIGCPTLTAIQECARTRESYPNLRIIADGGISNSGYALKAFAFGATDIIIGSLFGKSFEADNNGVIYGMSSYRLQDEMGKDKKSNEGRVSFIPKEEMKPLKEIFDEFTFGIRSGLSYLGIDDINKIDESEIEYVKTK